MSADEIVGYEFEVDLGDRCVWTQLQGSGGAYGDGSLYVTDPSKVERIAAKLLSDARGELENGGKIRFYNRLESDPSMRIIKVSASSVSKCRPIYTRHQNRISSQYDKY